ncbi:envelope glycoprotein [Trichinella pseudospiralis]
MTSFLSGQKMANGGLIFNISQIPAKSLVLNGWTCTGQRGRSTALWPLLLWRRANGQRPGSFKAANFYRCVPSPAHS